MSRTECPLIENQPVRNILNARHGSYHRRLSDIFGIRNKTGDGPAGSLPFGINDVTAGVEDELQTVVIGRGDRVDLPITIQESNYYKNLLRRTLSGDVPGNILTMLQDHIAGNRENAWENSWVWLPRDTINEYAVTIFKTDMLADKNNPSFGLRSDAARFIFFKQGRECIRVPVSYLLKLALADAIGDKKSMNSPVFKRGQKLLLHYLGLPEKVRYPQIVMTATAQRPIYIAKLNE